MNMEEFLIRCFIKDIRDNKNNTYARAKLAEYYNDIIKHYYGDIIDYFTHNETAVEFFSNKKIDIKQYSITDLVRIALDE